MDFEILLRKLYQAVINEFLITDTLLLNIGFSKDDINYLCTSKRLQKSNDAVYQFIDVRNLVNYAKYLITKKDHEAAEMCFLQVQKLDPYNHELCFHYFYKAINEYNFSQAFTYFQIIYSYENSFKEDYNFYFYMFSILIKLSEEDQEICANFHFSDFKSAHKNSLLAHDRIKKCAFDGCFGDALKILKELEESGQKFSVTEVIMKRFLVAARRTQILERKEIVGLIQKKEYRAIIDFLEQKQLQTKLNDENQSILELLKTYEVVSLTNMLPPKKVYDKNSVYKAIKKGDYERAFQCIKEFNERHHYNNIDSPIYLLLEQLITKINDIKAQNLKQNSFPANSEGYSEELEVILDSLKNELPNSQELIKSYLEKYHRSNYFNVVECLLMVNRNRKAAQYTFILDFLNLLRDPNYQIELTGFAYKYYHAKSKGRLKEATIFSDIIMYINEPEKLSSSKYAPSQTTEFTKYYSGIVECYATDLLNSKGLVILDAMSKKERMVIYSLVRKIPDLYAFMIHVEGEKRVVIKYLEPILSEDEINELTTLGNKAYEEEDYDACIYYYQRLMADTKTKGFIYNKIGHAYLKKHEYEQAIPYIMVGNSLYQDEREKYDYSNLLFVLKALSDSPKMDSSSNKAN